MHFKGDTITLDTAIVMDIRTYRGIRKGAATYELLRKNNHSVIALYDSIIENYNQTIISYDTKFGILSEGIVKRDAAIANMNTSIDMLADNNRKSIELMEDVQKKIKKPFLSPGFWIGFAAGVIGTSILLR